MQEATRRKSFVTLTRFQPVLDFYTSENKKIRGLLCFQGVSGGMKYYFSENFAYVLNE